MCLPRRGKIREEICTVASGPQRRKAHVELTPEVRADRPTWVLCLGGENRAVLNAYHTPWPHRASSNPAHLTKELQCHAAPCHVVCVCGGVDGALSTCILNTSGRVLCGSAHAPGRAARSCLTYRPREAGGSLFAMGHFVGTLLRIAPWPASAFATAQAIVHVCSCVKCWV